MNNLPETGPQLLMKPKIVLVACGCSFHTDFITKSPPLSRPKRRLWLLGCGLCRFDSHRSIDYNSSSFCTGL